MKRFVLACVLCSAMLAVGVCMFMPTGLAKAFSPPPGKENLIEALLRLPAPPPPNPLEHVLAQRDESFYDPKNPPPDNAPIEDLVQYWTRQSGDYRGALYFTPRPSERSLERLFDEAERSPNVIEQVLRVLPDDKRTAELVKQFYDRAANNGTLEPGERTALKGWLKLNSPYFTDELRRTAGKVRDSDGYVNGENQNEFLALARNDFESARPIIDQLYTDTSQPASRALATWALYRHAIDTDSIDVDRYRDELKRMVEDRSNPDGMRDMANDALARERDFPGRDEWFYSLLEDETLVGMKRYSMLSTLVMYSPPNKYVPKMIELLGSDNKTVRAAAARNLLVAHSRFPNPEIIRALLPWLENPKWTEPKGDPWVYGGGSDGDADSRLMIVNALNIFRMPESVPGLIGVLDEKVIRKVPDDSANLSNSNVAVSSVNAARLAEVSNNLRIFREPQEAESKMKEETIYPFRTSAIQALGKQADIRAVPPLRRLLNQATPYERNEIVKAIFACGGYSLQEQVDALEYFAKKQSGAVEGQIDAAAIADDAVYYGNMAYPRQRIDIYGTSSNSIKGDFDPTDMKLLLGSMVAASSDPSDALARSTIDRIEAVESKDPALALALRRIIVSWKGLAVSTLLLRDLKNNRAESTAVLRLLAERKLLREKLLQEVNDAESGTSTARGLSACILEEPSGYDAIIKDENIEAKIALFACGRLIRASLPVEKVAANLKSTNPMLKTAAELYLESEDSPAARAIVLGEHPGEAKVMGARMYFKGKSEASGWSAEMTPLFVSVSRSTAFLPSTYENLSLIQELEKKETRLEKEVKENADLLGLYSYENNFVRIYKDKAVFSWEDDPSRFHERSLSEQEFTRLKEYLAAHRVEELKPFLICYTVGCTTVKELLMLSRNGGSRVFMRGVREPEFFSDLDKIFTAFRAEPAAIKYPLSKEVAGLEILFASDDYDAQTVWKQGSDLRFVVSSRAVRTKVEGEISKLEDERDDDDMGEEGPDTPDGESPVEKMREKRQYEGFDWHKLERGSLGNSVPQPAGVDYIPPSDSLAVQPSDEQWKAKASGIEIRTNDNGLYKLARGKLSKLKEGSYDSPVVSSNGKWLVANEYSDEAGMWVVRYNLLTNREYKVEIEGYGSFVPQAYIPAVDKFLIVSDYGGEREGDSTGEDTEGDDEPVIEALQSFYLLDPETGSVTRATGEVRPLAQQTFRSLQPTSKPNEFWAAVPSRGRNETLVGIYDSRLFRFKPVIKLPKISFRSMDMWVDETEGKIYFVYNGHLLSVPFKKQSG